MEAYLIQFEEASMLPKKYETSILLLPHFSIIYCKIPQLISYHLIFY